MKKIFYKDAFGWGFIIWLIGYVLGILFFMFIPAPLLGWFIMPIGIVLTLWVLYKKIKENLFHYYLLLAIVWTSLAAILDYFFLVKMLNPADGYYKLDVYIYYALMFMLPIIVGWRKDNTVKNTFLLIQVLSGLAFINACYLSYKAYFVRFVDPQGLSSFCDISNIFSCTDVLRHPLSQVFNISFPWIATAVYPVLFVLALLGHRSGKILYAKVLAVISFLGILFNGFILYREAFYIHTYCLLCLLCTIIIVSIFVISVSIIKTPNHSK